MRLLLIFLFPFMLWCQHIAWNLNTLKVNPDYFPMMSTFMKEVPDEYIAINGIFKSQLKNVIRYQRDQGFVILEKHYFGQVVGIPLAMNEMSYKELIATLYFKDIWNAMVKQKLSQDIIKMDGNTFVLGTNIKSKAIAQIFGSSEVSISINGNVDMSLAGKTTKREEDITNIQQDNQSSFQPKIELKQQFYLDARIGDKLVISANQNSEAQMDLENVLKITYTGYEDEIIQKIEAGNIDLSLPGTKFVSGSTTHKGLFGLKTKLQFGDLYFTGIASLEKGQKNKLSFKNGKKTENNQSNTQKINDYDYLKYKFFFVDTLFRNKYQVYNPQNNFPIKDFNQSATSAGLILQLDAYLSTTQNDNPNDKRFITAISDPAYIGLLDTANNSIEGKIETKEFRKLTRGVDYDYDPERGFIYFTNDINDRSIAITYEVSYSDPNLNVNNSHWISPTDIDNYSTNRDNYLTFSQSNQSSKKYLKLIKSNNMKATSNNNMLYAQLERLHMKNVYRFGFKRDENIKVEIYRNNITENTVPEYKELKYTTVFGLDRLNTQSTELVQSGRGDDKLDYNNLRLFESSQARYLIFPVLEPFNPDPVAIELINQVKLNDNSNFSWQNSDASGNIYNYSTAVQNGIYTIEIDGNIGSGLQNSSAGSANSFDLGFGVLEGSERVTINNQTMDRGIDYDISYFSGQLVLKSPRAIAGKDNIDIEYESANFVQTDKKTFLGGRLEYNISDNSFIGVTGLYLSKSTLDEKVRIGQEPFENFSWGINGSYSTESKWMTDLINYLPGINTNNPSSFSFSAEYAQILPNPNTRKNEDLGELDGIAYIDDFESAKRKNGFSLYGFSWHPASIPKIVNNQLLGESQLDTSRVQISYFNPYANYPINLIVNRETNASDQNRDVRLLNLALRKKTRIYDDQNNEINVNNISGKAKLKVNTAGSNAWGGIMASNKGNSDLTNVRFLEIWVRWDYPERIGSKPRLNIDFGAISEDYYTGPQVNDGLAYRFPDNYLNRIVGGKNRESSEDIENFFADNILQEKEDVGFDRMSDEEEIQYYGQVNPYDNYLKPYENFSSYFFAGETRLFANPFEYSDEVKRAIPWRINGKEGNARSGTYTLYPDFEDIDLDGVFDQLNNYFHIEIPMDLDLNEIKKHSYFSAIGVESDLRWVQFRIPINDLVESKSFYPSNTPPSLTNVDFFRIYVDHMDALDEDDVLMLNFAEINFVGTDWQTSKPAKYEELESTYVSDENDVIKVSFLNSEENTSSNASSKDFYSDYYIAPPGAQGDFIDQERTLRGKEQSLVLNISDLQAGEKVEIFKSSKFISSDNLSLHNYKKLKLFLRSHLLEINESNINYQLPKTIDEFKQNNAHRNYIIIKMGHDPKNFYEYRVPLIPNKIDEIPDKDNENHRASYWQNGKIEINLDMFSVAKQKGFRERFSGQYEAYYIYENPDEPLLNQYRAVGKPDLTNIKFFLISVYNADQEIGRDRPLTSKIWANEFRASEVRKESGSAMTVSIQGKFSDIMTIGSTFLNQEADYHRISDMNQNVRGLISTETQSFNYDLNSDKFLPDNWGLSLPLRLTLNKSASIPKFLPGSDVRSFYKSENFFDKLKHMFGVGEFSDEIKKIGTFTEQSSITYSFKKRYTNDSWYYKYLVDNLSYSISHSQSLASDYQYEYRKSFGINHTLGYILDFGNQNFIEPFSWLGSGSLIDKISKVRLYYSPENIKTSLAMSHKEDQNKRRDIQEDNPVYTTGAERNFGISYKITDELTSNVNRKYISDIDNTMIGNRRMTLGDAINNLITNPFKKDALGNDIDVSNTFTLAYNPNIISVLQSTFNYSSDYKYKEDQLNKYASVNQNNVYTYKFSWSISSIYRELFESSTTPSTNVPTRTRGRRTDEEKKTDEENNNDINQKYNALPVNLLFQDKSKSGGLDINMLNPLEWGKDLIKAWTKTSVDYGIRNNNGFSALQSKQAALDYQFGFSDRPKIQIQDSMAFRIAESQSTDLTIGNSFSFSSITIQFDNLFKQTITLQDQGRKQISQSNTAYVFGDIWNEYSQYKSRDSIAVGQSFSFFIPNWNIEIRNVEKWPLIGLLTKKASLSHKRTGEITRGYRDTPRSLTSQANKIESYQFTYENKYSPLIKLNMNLFDIFESGIQIDKSERVNFPTAKTGSRTTNNAFRANLSYKIDGGFRFPFSFWPFNNAYVENSINLILTYSESSDKNEIYRIDLLEGIGEFQPQTDGFNQTFQVSANYSFSTKVNGQLNYTFKVFQNSRIPKTTSNEFSINVNLKIQN